MSGNQILDVKRATTSLELIVNFSALGDVNAGGVFDYKAVKGEERAEFSSLFTQLERDAGPIETMQISRYGENAQYSKITVTTGTPMDDIQAHNIQAVLEQRIESEMLESYPLVKEDALKGFEQEKRADREEYEPDPALKDSNIELYAMQLAVSIALKQTLPGVWKDGGDYIVSEVKPGEVELIAEGACIACSSAIEATTRKMFEDIAYAMSQTDVIKTPLESLHVFTPNFEPAYSIKRDGVYDAMGNRTRIFQARTPAPAGMQ